MVEGGGRKKQLSFHLLQSDIQQDKPPVEGVEGKIAFFM